MLKKGTNFSITSEDVLIQRVSEALDARKSLLEPEHKQALRLLNGFYEGFTSLVVDLFGRTLLVSNHAKPPDVLETYLPSIFDFYRRSLPWLRCGDAQMPKCSRSGFTPWDHRFW